MLTLKQRQERAARRAARIAAKHEAIRQAAAPQEQQHQKRSVVMKKHEVKIGSEYVAKVSGKLAHIRIDRENPHGGWDATNLATKKVVRIKSAQRLRAEAGRKATPAAHVAAGAKPTAEVAKDAKATPVAAGGGTANPLEAHYRSQKDAAKTEKAAKVAALRKDVAETVAKPDPELDATVKAAEEGRKAKKAKAAKPKGERKPSLLALAADVLKDAKAPMDCKAIVEKVLAKGTWQTKGKTPAATLYAAVIREIAAKGKDARFHKTDRGMFELSAVGK
jgi:hypothetical protein